MYSEVLYLGPQGSYSELAKNKFAQYFSFNCESTPLDSIFKIVKMLKEDCEASIAAVLPIENSVEGIVRDTQDNLSMLAARGIRIQAETTVPIVHSLVSFGNKDQIRIITSHPQAIAQCREYIHSNWGDDVILQPSLSTSAAIASLSSQEPCCAAIGQELCADLYNIPILDKGINDEKNNTTRFLLLSKFPPSKQLLNKVSITFSTINEVGALNKVLNVFEKHNLNLSYIDSRPSRKELGEYIFYVDFIGHADESNVSIALIEIQSYVKMFQLLSEGAICL